MPKDAGFPTECQQMGGAQPEKQFFFSQKLRWGQWRPLTETLGGEDYLVMGGDSNGTVVLRMEGVQYPLQAMYVCYSCMELFTYV